MEKFGFALLLAIPIGFLVRITKTLIDSNYNHKSTSQA